MTDKTLPLGITFHDEAVEIAYTRFPQDIKQNGLMWKHVVLVPRDSDYENELEALDLSIGELLADVLEDQELALPLQPVDYPDDDEEEE